MQTWQAEFLARRSVPRASKALVPHVSGRASHRDAHGVHSRAASGATQLVERVRQQRAGLEHSGPAVVASMSRASSAAQLRSPTGTAGGGSAKAPREHVAAAGRASAHGDKRTKPPRAAATPGTVTGATDGVRGNSASQHTRSGGLRGAALSSRRRARYAGLAYEQRFQTPHSRHFVSYLRKIEGSLPPELRASLRRDEFQGRRLSRPTSAKVLLDSGAGRGRASAHSGGARGTKPKRTSGQSKRALKFRRSPTPSRRGRKPTLVATRRRPASAAVSRGATRTQRHTPAASPVAAGRRHGAGVGVGASGGRDGGAGVERTVVVPPHARQRLRPRSAMPLRGARDAGKERRGGRRASDGGAVDVASGHGEQQPRSPGHAGVHAVPPSSPRASRVLRRVAASPVHGAAGAAMAAEAHATGGSVDVSTAGDTEPPTSLTVTGTSVSPDSPVAATRPSPAPSPPRQSPDPFAGVTGVRVTSPPHGGWRNLVGADHAVYKRAPRLVSNQLRSLNGQSPTALAARRRAQAHSVSSDDPTWDEDGDWATLRAAAPRRDTGAGSRGWDVGQVDSDSVGDGASSSGSSYGSGTSSATVDSMDERELPRASFLVHEHARATYSPSSHGRQPRAARPVSAPLGGRRRDTALVVGGGGQDERGIVVKVPDTWSLDAGAIGPWSTHAATPAKTPSRPHQRARAGSDAGAGTPGGHKRGAEAGPVAEAYQPTSVFADADARLYPTPKRAARRKRTRVRRARRIAGEPRRRRPASAGVRRRKGTRRRGKRGTRAGADGGAGTGLRGDSVAPPAAKVNGSAAAQGGAPVAPPASVLALRGTPVELHVAPNSPAAVAATRRRKGSKGSATRSSGRSSHARRRPRPKSAGPVRGGKRGNLGQRALKALRRRFRAVANAQDRSLEEARQMVPQLSANREPRGALGARAQQPIQVGGVDPSRRPRGEAKAGGGAGNRSPSRRGRPRPRSAVASSPSGGGRGAPTAGVPEATEADRTRHVRRNDDHEASQVAEVQLAAGGHSEVGCHGTGTGDVRAFISDDEGDDEEVDVAGLEL